MEGQICYLQRHPLFKTWQECKIALKSQYPGQCDGQVKVQGGQGCQSSCTLGIAGFPFGERPEVGVRGQGKMVKTTGVAPFIAIIAANVMLSCSAIIMNVHYQDNRCRPIQPFSPV